MFSERTLEEIQARINIVDLVAEYLTLKKSGSGFTALCPFHKEKTPSFHVHPVKQVFHCFGCHKGGNIFTFLRGIEGISFPLAVQKLAERAGVEIESTPSSRPKPSEPLTNASEKKSLEALEWAAKYFHYLLNQVHSPSQRATELLDLSHPLSADIRLQLFSPRCRHLLTPADGDHGGNQLNRPGCLNFHNRPADGGARNYSSRHRAILHRYAALA